LVQEIIRIHWPFIMICLPAGFVLIAIAIIDIKTKEIPDSLNIALFFIGISAIWLLPDITPAERIIGFFAVSFPLLLFAIFLNGSFGGGDVKLMAAAGFLLGWQSALVAFIISAITSSLYGITALALRKKSLKDHFAFGPFLAFGIMVALLTGNLFYYYAITP